jgi:Mor family transcriptional regulator
MPQTKPNNINAAPDSAWELAEFVATLLNQSDRTGEVAQKIREYFGGGIFYIRKPSDEKYDLIQEEIRKETRDFHREQCRKYGLSLRQYQRALHGRPRHAGHPDEEQLTILI